MLPLSGQLRLRSSATSSLAAAAVARSVASGLPADPSLQTGAHVFGVKMRAAGNDSSDAKHSICHNIWLAAVLPQQTPVPAPERGSSAAPATRGCHLPLAASCSCLPSLQRLAPCGCHTPLPQGRVCRAWHRRCGARCRRHRLVPSPRRCCQLCARPLCMHCSDLSFRWRDRQGDWGWGRGTAKAELRSGRPATTARQDRLRVLLGGAVLTPHGRLERHRLAGLPLQGGLRHDSQSGGRGAPSAKPTYRGEPPGEQGAGASHA